MKILLTGATGLIGKELGKALVAHGHQVVSVSRSAIKAKKLLPYQTEVVEWSGHGVFPGEKLADIDGVIHLMGESIAESRWTTEIKKQLIESRVNSTIELKKACDQNAKNLKFWIQGSAIGFYGDSNHEKVLDESSPQANGFLAGLCHDWEVASESGITNSNLRKVILRTGVVISHQGGALAKMMNPLLAGIGGVIGSGEQRMSVIHLTDMVNFIVHAAETETVKGVYNLVSEKPVSQKDFIHFFSNCLSISSGLSIPAFAIKLAMGEMADLLLQDQAVISTRMSDSGFKLQYPHFEQILTEAANWFQNPFKDTAPHSAPAHIYYSEQFVALPLEKVFSFFSDAKNLEKITPEWLNFHIVSVSTEAIEKNTKIEYQLKLHGVPLKWITDIAVWDPPHRFVDNQLTGPYHLWYHEHSFESVTGGTLMRDWVRFQLPLGKAGMVGLPKVYSDVKVIFAHRTEIIDQILLNN